MLTDVYLARATRNSRDDIDVVQITLPKTMQIEEDKVTNVQPFTSRHSFAKVVIDEMPVELVNERP